MNIDSEIIMNKIAQGIMSVEEGTQWFESHSRKEQELLLRSLSFMVGQAHPSDDEVNNAILKSGLSPNNCKPCEISASGRFLDQLPKIFRLPSSEFKSIFKLFISVLSIADERRRLHTCGEGCSHWWHEDLRNPKVIEKIKIRYTPPYN